MVRGLSKEVPGEVIDDVARFRYREHFKLSARQMLDEPDTAIEEAIFMWALDMQRDKLNTERQQSQ